MVGLALNQDLTLKGNCHHTEKQNATSEVYDESKRHLPNFSVLA